MIDALALYRTILDQKPPFGLVGILTALSRRLGGTPLPGSVCVIDPTRAGEKEVHLALGKTALW